ncbi:cytochrome C oxidase subunit II [Microvirga tunisiensis]|uniref:Cytochrome C oxidase subunit II n=1 Tax=Microvirga tunisiensis TaxID=2108360 RepID=A0A5N7MTD3_9HYPH|nr:cytochrome C oxidase subunit II [Microvirga tunisiensis]MPR11742.1 cytochrome C oxidase subunit II [Microvirga tunisiensis]MPR29729.1 cytochrome C oxidase subunit II [Microvirga tunisiensis]
MRADTEQEILKTELWWTALVTAVVTAIMLAIIYAGIVHHINPPSNIEPIDPKTLHLTGEFTEGNLGTRVEASDQVTSRIVATQFAFQPQCIVVSANRAVTLRFATPDVIHGILVTGTNVNTMIIPGYVSQVHTVFTKTGDLLMPCHEFCGLGHSQMWATVRVVPESEFNPDAEGRANCDAR